MSSATSPAEAERRSPVEDHEADAVQQTGECACASDGNQANAQSEEAPSATSPPEDERRSRSPVEDHEADAVQQTGVRVLVMAIRLTVQMHNLRKPAALPLPARPKMNDDGVRVQSKTTMSRTGMHWTSFMTSTTTKGSRCPSGFWGSGPAVSSLDTELLPIALAPLLCRAQLLRWQGLWRCRAAQRHLPRLHRWNAVLYMPPGGYSCL